MQHDASSSEDDFANAPVAPVANRCDSHDYLIDMGHRAHHVKTILPIRQHQKCFVNYFL